MNIIFNVITFILLSVTAFADTPPPGVVKSRTLDGAGTPITSTLSTGKQGLDVNVINSGGTSTVNQGTGGVSPWLVNINNTPLAVTGTFFQATQPVSQVGSWTVLQGSPPWSVSQSGTWTTGRTWTLLNSTDSVTSFQGGSWSATVSGTVTANIGTTGGLALDSTLSTLSAKFTTTANGLKVDGSAVTQPISAAALPLPSGASTSALQTTGNTSLASIDSKLTSPIAVTGTFFQAVQPVSQSGSWTVLQGSPPWSVSQSGTWTTGRTWTLLNTTDSVNVGNFPATFGVTQSTSPWVVSGTVAATQSGVWTTGRTWSLSSGSDSVAAVQSGTWNINNVSGTVSLPTGAATEATLAKIPLAQGSTTSGQSGSLVQGAVTTSAPSYSTGNTNPLSLTTSGALRVDGSATTQPVSGTVTANAGTGNFTVVQASGANLHVNVDSAPTTTVTGTVTANQGTSPWVSNISQFGGSNVVTGTGASGAGIPRVTVSNDSNVLATQSGTWNVNNVSGTVSLPTGASTSANQTGGGQKTQIVDGANATVGPVTTLSAVNYLPVVLASSATNAAAVPARAVLVAGSDGTNARNLSTDTSGNLNVVVTSTAAASRTSVNLARNVYSTTNVTTAAYVQLVASTSDITNQLFIFDSSGQTLVLATGAAASEVDKYYIVPGGNGLINLTIPASTRVSVKAVSATASSGELSVTFIK